MKYRIKRVDSLYYAQVKGFIFWDDLIKSRGSYEAAAADIEWDKTREKGIEIIPYVDSSERGLLEVNTKTPMPPVRPQIKVWISGQGKRRSNQQQRRNEQKTK